MKTFTQLVQERLAHVREVFPWDLVKRMETNPGLLLLDVREPAEFDALHIANSFNVPRGILEASCDWGYEETVPELAAARDREIVVICRSGNRSILAADSMQEMGFTDVASLKTGIRGWNDFEQPLVDRDGKAVTLDEADDYLAPKVRNEQLATDKGSDCRSAS